MTNIRQAKVWQTKNTEAYGKQTNYKNKRIAIYSAAFLTIFWAVFQFPIYGDLARTLQTSKNNGQQPLFAGLVGAILSVTESAAAKDKANSTRAQESISFWALLAKQAQGFYSVSNSTRSSIHETSPSLTPTPILYQRNFTIHCIPHPGCIPHNGKDESPPQQAIDATELEPFIGETHYNNGTNPIVRIVEGGGKPYFPPGVNTTDEKNLAWPTANNTDAQCTLRALGNYDEAPHNLQQIIRCFSWWQMSINKGKQPVLHIETWGRQFGLINRFEVIHAYYRAIEAAFRVRLVVGRLKDNTTEITVPAPSLDKISVTDPYEVKDPEHAKILMNGMLNHYAPNNTNRGCPGVSANSNKTKPNIGFLDRNDARRRLSNGQQVIDRLEAAGYHNIRYLSVFGNLTFVEQVKFMSEVDILMGPHGAQFTQSLYLPECGSLLEFFPREYYAPGWYGSLAALSGKHHFFIYNGGNINLHKARVIESFAVNPYYVEMLMPTMVERWESCCVAKRQQPPQQKQY
jgi:Glycosyltransferase 61